MDPWRMPSSLVVNNAAVSSDQPLATNIGIDILKKGGNAADAAIATAVAVSVLQPWTCGIGGDCQILFYRKTDKKVFAVNGSGRSGENADLQQLLDSDVTYNKYPNHGCWVSVPGAVAGIFALKEHFGSKKLSMRQVLQPVITLAEEGAPLPYKAASKWNLKKNELQEERNAGDIFGTTEPVSVGQKISSHKLANALKDIVEKGPEWFYKGNIAEKIVQEVQSHGGVLTTLDMERHLEFASIGQPSDGIFFDFHGFRVWEMKPNTIGIVVLVALNVLSLYDLKSMGHNSAKYIYIVAEAIKHAYGECWDILCDPLSKAACFSTLLSKDTAKRIKQSIDQQKRVTCKRIPHGGNTSYMAAVDAEGNGCSFIFSLSSSFGSKIIPDDCGFCLHDRLSCMTLDKENPNGYGPSKLCAHTIIPAMVTDPETNDLLAVFGLYGRWMQPQGHVQVLLNMIIFGMDPESALNVSRFSVGDVFMLPDYLESLDILKLEEGIPSCVAQELEGKGYKVESSIRGESNSCFGRGHIIASSKLWNKNVTSHPSAWFAAADHRADGFAMGF